MDQANRKLVLIIDDDTEFDAKLSEKISLAGMEPVVAVTGQEALSYTQNHSVDMIILDFVMPEMDGFKFYHELRHDLRKNIPTVVLTNLTKINPPEELEVFVKSQTNLDDFVNDLKNRLMS